MSDAAVLYVRDVAALLRRSEAAIYQATRRGRLPGRRWGGRLVFLAAELDAYLHALPSRPMTLKPSGKPEARDG
jgi:hypothetical protein